MVALVLFITSMTDALSDNSDECISSAVSFLSIWLCSFLAFSLAAVSSSW